jgi:hypothetical protein
MAVGVEQHRDQHRRVIRRPAMPIGPIPGTKPRQIQLIDHVDHEPHQMIRRQPIPHIRRQQEHLPTTRGDEVEPHNQILVATRNLITPPCQDPFMQQPRRRLLHKHLRAAPPGIESLLRKHVLATADGSAVCGQVPSVNTGFVQQTRTRQSGSFDDLYSNVVQQRTAPHDTPNDRRKPRDVAGDRQQLRAIGMPIPRMSA